MCRPPIRERTTMKKIFFINYLYQRPFLPNIKDKYEMLSDSCHGDMTAICDGAHDKMMLGRFRFHAIPRIRTPGLKQLVFIVYVIATGLSSHMRRKIDIIVSYDPLLCGLSAYLLRLVTGAKLVIELNGDVMNAGFLEAGPTARSIKRSMVVNLARFILNRADRIKFLTRQLEQAYRRHLRHERYVVFCNFVPTHIFREGENAFERFVLFVGFPFHLKGVDTLIEAFNDISGNHPDFTLRIIGHCPDPGPFERLAGGNPRIEIKKAVYYDEIVTEFKRCYCFALASRSEGLPRVLIEAMAGGKPVVASRVGGIPELVEDGVNGFLFEKENSEELAGRLSLLLGDEDRAREMGGRGREFVERNLSSAVYTERLKELFEELG